MKKKTILLFLFIFSVISGNFIVAQVKSFERIQGKVAWYPPAKSQTPDGESTLFLTCENCETAITSFKTPVKHEFLHGKKVESVGFLNQSWSKLSDLELEGLDTVGSKLIPSFTDEKFETEKGWGTRIAIKLIRKENNVWEKLNTYVLSVSSLPLIEKMDRRTSSFRTVADANSVFATGPWVKMGIVNTGVYELTVNDLTTYGLDLNGKISNQIKIYGTGGKMLSESRAAFNFNDIPEIPIQVVDGGDGVFNANDRILFYGQDADSWNYRNSTKAFEFTKNIYSDTSYYFITFSEGEGKRVQAQAQQNGPVEVVRSTFLDRFVYSPEKINVLSAGRKWYADVLDFTPSKTITIEANGLLTDSLVKFRYEVMARSAVSYPFKISVNDVASATSNLGTVSLTERFSNYGSENNVSFNFQPTNGTNTLNFNILYDKQGNLQSLGYINFVEAFAWKKLQWENKNFGFRFGSRTNKIVQYTIGGFPSNGIVWNVSRPLEMSRMNIQNQSFVVLEDTIQEFFAFTEQSVLKPLVYKTVRNQNLRGLSVPDLLIVSHPLFMVEAKRLADFRRDHDQLNVEVVSPEQIYNEFSSGSQDVTAIRNLGFFLYKKESPAKLKYLLLFGDCSFDYKNRTPNNSNFVPVYEGPPNLNIVSSYASDDYYGIYLGAGGQWSETDLMDIGVGRLPAKNINEAKNMVDKLIHYASSPNTLGDWRTRYTFVADNGDSFTHSDDAESLSITAQQINSNSLSKKIFIGAYELVASPGGLTAPRATNELLNSIEKGNLIVNYTGHGGETVWADEFLFTSEMISSLQNKDKLSFFITATCDFGRHDYPTQTSGAEELILNPNGGAVGVMTTGRPVLSSNNSVINKAFYNNYFTSGTNRMGDVLRLTKNGNSSKSNNRGFTLLGDPSAKISFPEQKIVLKDFSSDDTIKGLELTTIKGEVLKDSLKNETFNGTVDILVLDAPGSINVQGAPAARRYPVEKNILYKGSAPVINGEFTFRFFVSKDVSFDVGKGRILLYAYSDKTDASGSEKVNVGGLNSNPINDVTGPQMSLFMNDVTFVNYGLVGKDADLLVFLEDDLSGINVSGLGLGHDLTGTLDGNQVFVLNDYFKNEPGSYSKGSLRFPMRDLTPGIHNIVVKCWDSFNNSTEKTIYFEVGIASVNGRMVKEVKLFPNPSNGEVFLELENAFAGSNLEIRLIVYDIIGNLITEKIWDYDNSSARPGAFKELAWNGEKPDGSKLPAGTYFCKIGIKSDTDGSEYKINKKIVLIR
jgi:hypothetical protein